MNNKNKINPFDTGYYNSEQLIKFGFNKVGDNVSIAKNCTIIGLENISIGSNVRIDSGTLIAATKGSLILENYIHISAHCHLACTGGLIMRSFSGLSQGVKVFTVTDNFSEFHLMNPTIPSQYFKPEIKSIVLEKHVIIGSGSVVMPGVTIGEGSTVGALSFIKKSLEPWGVYAGVPVRKLKSREKNLLDDEKDLILKK